MKKFCLPFLFLATSAFSALPPLAQSIKEIQAILADSKFYSSLGSAEIINEIVRNDGGYLISTQNYTMQVNVNNNQNGGIGPVKFSLDFQEPVQLNSSSF